jgi:hypothetical protein
MARIEDRDKARSLARAIMADVTLYNSAKLQGAADPVAAVASEIEEARALFETRVTDSLFDCFDEQLVRWASDRGGTYVPSPRTAHRPAPSAAASRSPAEEQREREQERVRIAVAKIKRQRIILLAGMLLITAAVIAFFAVERREEHQAHDKKEGQH